MAHTPNMRPFVRRLGIALCLLLPPTAMSQILARSDKMVVVSVGTRTRPELQDTQKQTFAKHLETWFYDEVDSLLQQQLMSVARALPGFLTIYLLSPEFPAEECTASFTSCPPAGCGTMRLHKTNSIAAGPLSVL